jgi:hypothetical protein
VTWAHGVDRMGKNEWAGLPGRLAACLPSREPVPGKQPTPVLCYFTGIEGSASQRYRGAWWVTHAFGCIADGWNNPGPSPEMWA